MQDATLFLTAFGVSAFGGLAALLRSNAKVGGKAVASSMLNCGILGLALSLVWYSYFPNNPHLLVGLCILAGLGGIKGVEFVLDTAKRLATTFAKQKEEPK